MDLEKRKKEEIEYYDREANNLAENEIKEAGSLASFNPLLLGSYKFLYKLIEKYCQDKKVLDYGCGTGVHLPKISKVSKEVIGIDLSEKSLAFARKKIEKEHLENAKTLLMDCEKLDFPDNYFDVVFDGGTFSSIDFEKSFPEIVRVLKPGGYLVGIETFGHNPLTNLKRFINKKMGKRTGWAVNNILKIKSLNYMEKFGKVDVVFFHIVSWAFFPLFNLPGGKFLLKIGEELDNILLIIFPFFKKYSFKIVFIFSKPKK